MAETEKITINLSVVDLGKIDLLVDQGFYSTRTDVIRTAIRNQLDAHNRELTETIDRQALAIGVLAYSKSDLEKKRAKNEMLSINMVGMLFLLNDITPELALATIKSVRIFGTFKASKEVKEALADRIHD